MFRQNENSISRALVIFHFAVFAFVVGYSLRSSVSPLLLILTDFIIYRFADEETICLFGVGLRGVLIPKGLLESDEKGLCLRGFW
jgi:hypothetical protein